MQKVRVENYYMLCIHNRIYCLFTYDEQCPIQNLAMLWTNWVCSFLCHGKLFNQSSMVNFFSVIKTFMYGVACNIYKKLPQFKNCIGIFSLSNSFVLLFLSLSVYPLPLFLHKRYCGCVDVTAPELNRQGDESWRAAQFIPPSVRLSSSYSFRYPVYMWYLVTFSAIHSSLSFWWSLFYVTPPPPQSPPLPPFYTVPVCSFSFKGLSQSQRLGGQKWVSWNMTYSYLMCYAKYLWILSLIFNSQLNLHRESHLRLRNPNLVQWYYGCSYSEISLILLAPITSCICTTVRCT